MSTWPDLPADHPFGPQNLPYGAFLTEDAPSARLGVRIGDQVLDLGAAAGSTGSGTARSAAAKPVEASTAAIAIHHIDRRLSTSM